MSDIRFVITFADPNIGAYSVEVDGPLALPDPGPNAYSAVVPAPVANNLVDISLTNDIGNTLFIQGNAMTPPEAVLPPGLANTPAEAGLCCEVRNESGFTVDVRLLSSTLPFTAASLSNGMSIYFIVDSPVTNTQFSEIPCCVAEDTCLETPDGNRIRIQHARSGDLILDHNRQPARISKLIKFDVPTRDFVRLDNLHICRDHPVLDANYQERPCQCLDNAELVQVDKALSVYTIVTAHKTFVLMYGQAVATWSEAAWRTQSLRCPHKEF